MLAATRPTAVNLFWALERMKSLVRANASQPPVNLKIALEYEALAIAEEDLRLSRAMGRHGEPLLRRRRAHPHPLQRRRPGHRRLRHGPRRDPRRGRRRQEASASIADETRPLLQGARLTAWELQRDGIPVTLICDNMAGWLMAKGEIDGVIVGADRIAANGDTANKIGTYGVAVLAQAARHPLLRRRADLAPSTCPSPTATRSPSRSATRAR